ncbi:hypothetical protein WA026_021326 [Henosepilachna vigintioctopunctata]|uniref:Uncharacterized protein n=1 Tax=Henosepilachna vigintioctopunctata TaxID=420089 RepID=A0AAW1UEK9_9CUCU
MSFEEQERKFTSAILEGFVGLINMGVDIDKIMTELAEEIGEEAKFATPKKTAKTKNTLQIPGPSTSNQFDALSDSEISDMEYENNTTNDEPAVTHIIQTTKQDNQNKIPQSS